MSQANTSPEEQAIVEAMSTLTDDLDTLRAKVEGLGKQDATAAYLAALDPSMIFRSIATLTQVAGYLGKEISKLREEIAQLRTEGRDKPARFG